MNVELYLFHQVFLFDKKANIKSSITLCQMLIPKSQVDLHEQEIQSQYFHHF